MGGHYVPIVCLLLSAAYSAQGQPLPAPTGVSAPKTACLTALASSPFTSLNTLIEAAGLGPGLADIVINGGGGITIFAPLNAALAALPSATLKYLSVPENVDDLQALLLTHVVGQSLSATQLTPGSILSLSGEPIVVSKSIPAGNLTIDRLPITAPDALAVADCYIHGLGGVLVPASLSRAAGLNSTTLATPLATAPAPAPLAPAPAPAPLKAPAPAPALQIAPAPAPAASVNCSVLLTAAAASGNFSQLLGALSAANLTSVLRAQLGKPTTIFAFYDSAVQNLPPVLRAALVSDPAVLQAILSYHIANGYYPTAVLMGQDGRSIPSINQELPIPVKVSSQQLLVGFNQPPATITQPNLGLINGSCVLHGINEVIFPPGFVLPLTNATAPATAPATAAGASSSNATAAPLPTVTGGGARKGVHYTSLGASLLLVTLLKAIL